MSQGVDDMLNFPLSGPLSSGPLNPPKTISASSNVSTSSTALAVGVGILIGVVGMHLLMVGDSKHRKQGHKRCPIKG